MFGATGPVTSPEWWQQVIAAVVSAGAVIGSIAASLKWLPGLRTWWAKRQQARKDERRAEVADALGPLVVRLDEITASVEQKHQENQRQADEVKRQLEERRHETQREADEVKRQLEAIHRRIDDHMIEERDERRKDRAELREWLNVAMQVRDR